MLFELITSYYDPIDYGYYHGDYPIYYFWFYYHDLIETMKILTIPRINTVMNGRYVITRLVRELSIHL